MAGTRPIPELARPYFTRQAQYGRRVVFAWRPSAAAPTNPLTTPWPGCDELIEGVAFASEAAARRFDLDHAAGPDVEFLSWDEAERWLRDQPA